MRKGGGRAYLQTDRERERERERESKRGRKRKRVTRLYNVNYVSIFHIETVAQHSRMLPKSNMSVHTKWIYRYFHMYT